MTTFSSPLPAELAKGGELVFHKHGSQRFLKIIRTAEGRGVRPGVAHGEGGHRGDGRRRAVVGMR